MIEQDSSPIHKQCIACRENILPDALICPKCRSHQKPRRWITLLLVVKWIGGVTAVISLIIGVKQISGIVKDWKDRDKAVHQIIVSSTMLVNMRDYQAAWQIAKKATALAPSSQKAFDQQVDVALAWLKDIWVQKEEKTYSEIIDPLILTLSQGAGDDNPNRAAKILSHIGWANALRLKDKKVHYEVERYLIQALKYNPESTYANLFRGYWLLSKYNKNEDNKNKLSDSMAHFAKALNNGENSHFVNKWYVYALTGSYVIGADVEAFKIANAWRKQKHVPVEQSDIKNVLGTLHWDFYSLNDQLPEKGFPRRLIKELSFQDIRDTYLWLLSEGESDRRVSQDLRSIMNLGHIAEAADELETAYDYYVELLNKAKGSSSGYQETVGICLCRILTKCLEKGVTLPGVQSPDTFASTIVLNGQEKFGFTLHSTVGNDITELYEGPAKKGGLIIGDILLKIDNDPLEGMGRYRYAKLDQIRQDIISGKIPYADLFILREKKIICYRIVKEYL